jgi:hypothetical protein
MMVGLYEGRIDLEALSARSRAIVGTMGQMLADGYSKAEIARHYGKSRPWVTERFKELEREIRAQVAEPTDGTDGLARAASYLQ